MRRPWLIAALSGLAIRAWAGALDAPHRDLLGAAAAGMGGLDVVNASSLEALLYNPAALPESGLHAGAFSGLDAAQRGQAGLGFSAPVDDGLRLGLFVGALQDPGVNALQAQTLGLAASAELRPGVSVGLRALLHQLQAPALEQAVRGGSLDLGWQARALQAPFIPGRWSLGLSADHVLGFWPDATWAQALPQVGRAGVGYRPWPSLSLGVQSDWSSAPQLPHGSTQTWHGGLQWEAWRSLALRAGWSDDGQNGQASVGTGIEWAPWGAGLDYALTYAPGSAAFSHRAALRWAWAMEPRADLSISASQILRDPDNGVVRRARLQVSLSPLLRSRPWRVELKDEQGRLHRTLAPADAQDSSLEWDGRDSLGRPLSLAQGLRADLVAQGAKGVLRVSAALTLEQAAQQLDLAQAEPTGTAPGGALPAPTFKPVFEDAAGKELSHVLIALPALRTRSWSLDVQDSREHSLRKLAGVGDLPGQLVWDGRDDQGRKVNDALGLQMKLQVVDRKGVQATQQQPLFTQQAYTLAHREARQRPELRLAALGLPLQVERPLLDWLDGFLSAVSARAEQRYEAQAAQERRASAEARRRRYRRQDEKGLELDLFDADESLLLDERLDLLEPVEQTLREGSEQGQARTLWITGLARKDEKEPLALARSRAVALAKQLRKHGEDIQIVLDSPAEPGEFKGVRLEFR